MLDKRKVVPDGASAPLGAYSPGISIDIGTARLLFVSGQIPVDGDGQLYSDDVTEQTRFVFDRLADIAAAAGGGLGDVVKVQIFLTDLDDYPAVSKVRNEMLGDGAPASTLVEVSRLVVPGCRIEIDAIVAVPHPDSGTS